jgi:predicted Zn-dependent protease
MRAISLLFSAVFLQTVLATPTRAAFEDGHSLQAVREALQSPIPQSMLDQARQTDDQILRTGMVDGTKVSLVTDERLQRTQDVVRRVLSAIGETPQNWVVRVLDTEPKTANAFVYGGKYIYVYTGLIEQVRSDSELAVVVGHEMGHSILKHGIRRAGDLTSTLANLASVIGQLKGGAGGANAMAIGKALHSGYSRDDEREADAFGVLAAWRAGFDPLRGADFFTRQEQADDKAQAAESKQLAGYKDQALQVKSQCDTWTQQWNSGQIPTSRPQLPTTRRSQSRRVIQR